jgi:dTDP-4-dehydrorhamnose 3,5-epimerase-like enzyme
VQLVIQKTLRSIRVGLNPEVNLNSEYKILVKLDIKRFFEKRGILSAFEITEQINFDVKRVYYVKNVPDKLTRGEHGHKELEQIFICISGKFTLEVFDGTAKESVIMSQESDAYFVPKGCWREIKDFSIDGICLVLASASYDEKDYIHDLEYFKEWKNS